MVPGLTELTKHKKFHKSPIKLRKKFLSMNLNISVMICNTSLWKFVVEMLPLWNLLWLVSYHYGTFYGLYVYHNGTFYGLQIYFYGTLYGLQGKFSGTFYDL